MRFLPCIGAFGVGYVSALQASLSEGHPLTRATYLSALVGGFAGLWLYLVDPVRTTSRFPLQEHTNMPTLTPTLNITDGIPGLPSSYTIPLPAIALEPWEADVAQALIPSGASAELDLTVTVVSGALVFAASESADAGTLDKSASQSFSVKTNVASLLGFFIPSTGLSVKAKVGATISA